jgi:hypothetical protein
MKTQDKAKATITFQILRVLLRLLLRLLFKIEIKDAQGNRVEYNTPRKLDR